MFVDATTVYLLLVSLFWTSNAVSLKRLPTSANVIEVTQKIDHFTFGSKSGTFRQRLVISDEFWGANGSPIFFYAGGESNVISIAKRNGFVWQNAPTFKALIVFSEHRFYGESLPFGQSSFESVDQYKYLTVDQALQDIAYNIQWVKSTFNATDSPVIAFGGSYGGMLAAWSRMKYPHLVEGALSSSAPIAQFTGQYDCNKYYDVVTQDYTEYNETCAQVIRLSWPAMRRMASKEHGLANLLKTFRVCPGEDISIDQLVSNLQNAFEFLTMTDYPNEGDLLKPLPPYPIGQVCRFLNNSNATDEQLVQQVANGLSIYFNYTGSVACNSMTTKDEVFRGFEIQL